MSLVAAEDLADVLGLEGVEPSFMLWGDSHALALASAVNLTAADAAEGGLIAVRTGCPRTVWSRAGGWWTAEPSLL